MYVRTVLKGTKRLTLWPPSARENLYVASKYNHGAELSEVDAAAPNLTRHPRFARARSLSVLLSPGSALYLPAGWWHAVTSLDATISLALRAQGRCERRAVGEARGEGVARTTPEPAKSMQPVRMEFALKAESQPLPSHTQWTTTG